MGTCSTSPGTARYRIGRDADHRQAGRRHGRRRPARPRRGRPGLAILATIRSHLGSLDKVVRLIKTLGMVNSTPDFDEQPKVINGYSDLMKDVFGDAGVGTRSAVGMGALARRDRRRDRGDLPGQGT